MQSAPEPLSWLTLERYALGELSADERAQVEARLATSEADRACLAEILEDKSELPALDANPVVVSIAAARERRRPQWLAWSAALAAAAAALIIVLRDPVPHGASTTGDDDHVKGSEVTLRLISDRQGHEPTHFNTGERFKVQLSCPASLSQALRVFVVQGSQVFEPVPRDASFRCGNLVTWPGAFALDGNEPADVCVYWGSNQHPTASDFEQSQTSCSRLAAP
jgi:anti-sigma factor RsiW